MGGDSASVRCGEYCGVGREGRQPGKLTRWLQTKEDYPGLECVSCEAQYREEGRDTPCDGCPIFGVEPLNAENSELVRLYQGIASQITYDLHLAPMLLERTCGELSTSDFLEIIERMNLIHITMQRIAKQRAEAEKA